MVEPYGNGIEREEVREPLGSVAARVLWAVRQGNGSWSLGVELKGEVVIDEVRTIRIDRLLNVRERQRGRRKYRKQSKDQ